MPSPCFVPGCKGNYSSSLTKVSSYSFPRDEMLKKKWLEVIHRTESNISKYSRVCELHFIKSDFETEASAYDPKSGVTLTCPLARKRLKKGVIPSLLLPTFDSVSSSKKSSSKQKNQFKARSSNTIKNKLKWTPVRSSVFKDSSQTTSPATRFIMPRRCSVAGCRSGYDTEKEKTNTFSLPKEESLRLKWLKKIPNDVSKFKQPVVCIKHFTESSIIRVDRVTVNGEQREYPRVIPKLAKNAVPSIFPDLPSSVEKLPDREEETFDSAILQNITEHKKILGNNNKEESSEMVKRKRKSTTSEKIKPSSTKKLSSSSKLNGTHTSNHVQTSEKSTDSKSKADKPVCTNPEAFAYLNLQVKQEPLSDEEAQNGPSGDSPEENISENVQITNVRSLSSERSVPGSPSAEVNAVKKSEEGLDSDFYSKPLDMDQRDKAFGSFVACELSDLRANPALYMKTKQAILKLLTEAHFEQMSSCKKS